MKYPVSPQTTPNKIFGRTTFKFNILYHYIKMLFNFTKVNNSYNIKRLVHKTPFFATRNWRWWPVCFLNFFNHIWQRCDYRFMKKKQWSIILSITSSLKNIRVNILRYIPSTHVSIPEKDFIQRRIQKPIKHLR